MAADDEKPAGAAKVNQIIRRKLRKQPEHEDQSLNIYPLMDVMTILLVFMIMQFAQESANIIQSSELQIPYSTSQREMENHLAVQIYRNQISVDGRRVIPLNDGYVNANDKQDGGNGLLITRMFDIMKLHADTLQQIANARGDGSSPRRCSIISDQRTPWRTMSEVIYTLGQAGFSDLRFVVLQEGAGQVELGSE